MKLDISFSIEDDLTNNSALPDINDSSSNTSSDEQYNRNNSIIEIEHSVNKHPKNTNIHLSSIGIIGTRNGSRVDVSRFENDSVVKAEYIEEVFSPEIIEEVVLDFDGEVLVDFRPLESLTERGKVYLDIRRNECLEDTLSYIYDNQLNWRQTPNVKFIMESGVDAGGVTRSYLSMLIYQLNQNDSFLGGSKW